MELPGIAACMGSVFDFYLAGRTLCPDPTIGWQLRNFLALSLFLLFLHARVPFSTFTLQEEPFAPTQPPPPPGKGKNSESSFIYMH